jgi:hypothetical protein
MFQLFESLFLEGAFSTAHVKPYVLKHSNTLAWCSKYSNQLPAQIHTSRYMHAAIPHEAGKHFLADQ